MKPLTGFGIIATATTACYVAASLFSKKFQEKFKLTKLYTEAIETLRSHEGAKAILGEPITDGYTQFISSSLFNEGVSEAMVIVEGPKSKGVMYIIVMGNSPTSYILDSIQLQVGNDKNRRLIIKEPLPRLNHSEDV